MSTRRDYSGSRSLWIYGILSFCLFACVQCSVTVLGHNITTTFVLIEHGGSPSATENITYELIFDDGGDLTGKFVLLVSPVPIENSLRNIQSRGAVGALVQSRQDLPPGRNMYYVTGENTDDITLVAGDIWFQDYNTVRDLLNASQNGTLTISISGFDENRWETVVGAPGMIAWQVLLAAIHVATLIFTIVMFVFSVKQQGCRLNVVQFICISEALGLMIRGAYICVDPLFIHRITHYTASQVLITFSFPFGMATNFLVIFYWQEVLSKRRTKLTVSPFLERLKPLFIVVIIVLFILDLAGGLTRGLDLPAFSTVVIANAAVYNVALLVMSIWIFLTYRKTSREFIKTKRNLSTKDKKLQRISRLIMLSGIFNLLVVVSALCILIRPLYWSPVGFYTIWFVTYTFFTARGFIQILVITPRRGLKATTDTSFRSSVNMESGPRSLSNVSGVSKGEQDSLRESKPAEEFKTKEPTAAIELSTADITAAPERTIERDDSKEKLNQDKSDSKSESSTSSSSSSSTSSNENTGEIEE
jgi:hypothetical protein